MTTDPIEREFESLCVEFGLPFERPERDGGRLDFYVPALNLYVEVKAHSCERLHAQLETINTSLTPCFVLIGRDSVKILRRLMRMNSFS